MIEVAYRRWILEADVAGTREAFRRVESGSPERCGCDHCINFAAARRQLYPAGMLELFRQLGIDPAKETETYHLTRLDSGLHLYGGWFHFIGRLSSGPDAKVPTVKDSSTLKLVELDERFSLGFTKDRALAWPPFERRPLVQVEFTAEVPWVLADVEEPAG